MKRNQTTTMSGIDYEPFEAEKSYISPDQVGEEILNRIEQLPLRLATIEATNEDLW